MKLKNLTHEEFLMQFKSMGACSRGIKYIEKNKYDLKTFWENSCNHYYLYWYANKIGANMRQIVLSAIKIARLNKLSEKSENALIVCEKWVNGDDSITYQELRNVALAAYSRSDNAAACAVMDAEAADYSAWSAACAARVAYDAAYAAYWYDEACAVMDAKAADYSAWSAACAAEAVTDACWAAEAAEAASSDKKQEIFEIIRGLIEINEN